MAGAYSPDGSAKIRSFAYITEEVRHRNQRATHPIALGYSTAFMSKADRPLQRSADMAELGS
eukprot:scaffold142054_cov51-Prasinocladus_malaysianus.AAC.3